MKRRYSRKKQFGRGFTQRMRKTANLENAEDDLYDIAYGPKSSENMKIAYNRLYAKNLNDTDKPLHTTLNPISPKTSKGKDRFKRKTHMAAGIQRTARPPSSGQTITRRRPAPHVKDR